MRRLVKSFWLMAGLVLGTVGTALYFGPARQAEAYNDRSEDFIMCTGAVALNFKIPSEAVWLLDYRSGKLLGTVIDRVIGKIVGFAEVDLVTEFGLQPKDNVHFMMTTGTIAQGQSALYIAETSTGKFAVYTIGPRPDGRSGLMIRRQDQLFFRAPPGQPPPG